MVFRFSRSAAALAICAVATASSVTDAAPTSTDSKREVVLFGSSSVNDAFGHIISADLERDGFHAVRKGYGAAGLSRPDFRNMLTTLPSIPVGPQTEAFVFHLGGNDAQALFLTPEERQGKEGSWIAWEDQRWSEVYEARARKLIDMACDRGVRTVVVLPPVDVVSAGMQQKLERVRSLQAKAAGASKCGKFVSTSGDAGHLKGSALRNPDGVHMTREGASRVWGRIGPQVRRLISAAHQG